MVILYTVTVLVDFPRIVRFPFPFQCFLHPVAIFLPHLSDRPHVPLAGGPRLLRRRRQRATKVVEAPLQLRERKKQQLLLRDQAISNYSKKSRNKKGITNNTKLLICLLYYNRSVLRHPRMPKETNKKPIYFHWPCLN